MAEPKTTIDKKLVVSETKVSTSRAGSRHCLRTNEACTRPPVSVVAPGPASVARARLPPPSLASCSRPSVGDGAPAHTSPWLLIVVASDREGAGSSQGASDPAAFITGLRAAATSRLSAPPRPSPLRI
uniref:Uncharacterized protein n=1 Tax=Oryza sativa subsp. japonica TaxID=39947 RepID=Q84SD9_ORYSJ|nr:hypothetical protein [Oryza sativa Japonica Group]